MRGNPRVHLACPRVPRQWDGNVSVTVIFMSVLSVLTADIRLIRTNNNLWLPSLIVITVTESQHQTIIQVTEIIICKKVNTRKD